MSNMAQVPDPSSNLDTAEIVGVTVINVVIIGRDPGIFVNQGKDVSANILSITNTRILKFNTINEATAAFLQHLSRSKIIKVALVHDRTTLRTVNVAAIPGLDPSLIPQDAEAYYCVYVGRAPGIYPKSFSVEVNANMHSIPKVISELHLTYAAARAVFLPMLAIGKVIKVFYDINECILTLDDFEE